MSLNTNAINITRGINALSDTSGQKNSVGGVYIGTNETKVETTALFLQKHPQLPEACHIGFSSWHNFDIIVQRQSTRAVLCDFNPDTKSFLDLTLSTATRSETRQIFCEVVKEKVENKFTIFSINVGLMKDELVTPDEEVELELNRNGSWLSTDNGFNYIKKLALEGKISVITRDIRSHETFGSIAKILKENAVAIDTLYVSNISRYMRTQEDMCSFTKTIDCLMTHQTKLILCPTDNLEQFVLERRDLQEEDQLDQDKLFAKTSFSTFLIEECEKVNV
ncbi:MAG: hypothetical protein WA347_09215 [Rhabdochlamydiaceae bacterium]